MTENMNPTNTNVLTLEDILRGGDSPAWPVNVEHMTKAGQAAVLYLRPASALEMMQLIELPTESDESIRARIRLVLRCVSDKEGNRLIPEDKLDEAATRLDTPMFALLFKELMNRSGIETQKAAVAEPLPDGGAKAPGNG